MGNHLFQAILGCFSTGSWRLKAWWVSRYGFPLFAGGGFVWEHYTVDFEIDWEYNKNDPSNIYRPWGFQPGHQQLGML